MTIMSIDISNENIIALLKNITTQNENIARQNIEIKRDTESLRTQITDISNEIEKNKAFNKQITEENKILNLRVQNLEKKSKKYNIVVYGLKGDEIETYGDVLNFVNNTLEILVSEKDIRDVYRIGKNNEKNPRPAVVEFISYKLKSQVLLNAKEKLKGTGIYVALDYTQEEYTKRKFLLNHLKLAKEKGLTARIHKDTLTINGEIFKYEDLLESSNSAEENEMVVPFVNSAPATPNARTATETEFSLSTSPKDSKKENRKRKEQEETPGKPTGTLPKIKPGIRSSSRTRPNQYKT